MQDTNRFVIYSLLSTEQAPNIFVTERQKFTRHAFHFRLFAAQSLHFVCDARPFPE